MFLGGILCPQGVACVGEEDATGAGEPNFATNGTGGRRYAIGRYYTVINELGGIAGSIADNQGNGFSGGNLANIGLTIEAILRAVVTGASPYQLSKDPIASTIKVAVEGPTVGACNIADVPRVSTLTGNGFLYDAASNSIAFIGTCRPANAKDIALSYRTWIDLTGDPDGNNDPCGDCPSPFICINDQCLCPGDCGVAGGLGDGQTCDPVSCTTECLADCGGCAPGQVCDVNSADCACGCPADCNFGGALPAGFVCDQATCQPKCAPNGCQGAPPGPGFVCGPNCVFECPSDCGGLPSPQHDCNTTTCQPECSPDCNASCDGFTSCNTDTCTCECVENATCAPGFEFDAASCDCLCSAAALACPAAFVPNLDSCSCDCAPDCGGACPAGTICNASLCECRGIGG